MSESSTGTAVRWHPILLGDVIRSPRRRQLLPRLALLVGSLTVISVLVTFGIEKAGGFSHPLRIGEFSIATVPYPPLAVAVLALFWVGPAAGILTIVAANLVFGYWIGLPMPWLLMYGAGDVLLILLFACSFALTGAPIDLRSRDSGVVYVFTSIAGAISVLPAAIVWAIALPGRMPAPQTALQEWFSGCLVALTVLVAPALFWLTVPALRARDRMLRAPGTTTGKLRRYGERMLWVALGTLAAFVVAADLLVRAHLASMADRVGSVEAQDALPAMMQTIGLFTYALLALSLVLIVGLIYVRRRVTESLEKTIGQRTASLRRTVAELEHAQTIARTAAWVHDRESGETTFSRSTSAILGVRPEGDAASIETLASFVHPKDRDEWLAALERAESGDAPLDMVARVVRPDGEVRWIHFRARRDHGTESPSRVAGTLVDVTEWRERERELKRLTARVEQIVEHSPAAIVILDTHGTVALWSPAAERIFGWPAEEVVGLPPPFVGEEHRPSFQRHLKAVLDGTPLHNLEIPRVRADGGTAWVSLSVAPIPGDEGGVAGAVGIMVDISETIDAREALRELSEQLEEQVRKRTAELTATNENLEAFVQTASHDLQAPLRAIGSFSELLRERHGAELSQRGREYLDRIIVSRDRMARLIRDVLGYSRVGRSALSVQAVDVTEVLREIGAGIEDRQPGTSIEMPAEELTLTADSTLVRQIFTNLLENAVAYTAPGESPSVRVEIERGDAEDLIRVCDRGIGIEPRHQGCIFRAFERLHTEDEYAGTGLGLTIVRRCLDLLAWDISLESVPGAGSTFTVHIPHATQRGD